MARRVKENGVWYSGDEMNSKKSRCWFFFIRLSLAALYGGEETNLREEWYNGKKKVACFPHN